MTKKQARWAAKMLIASLCEQLDFTDHEIELDDADKLAAAVQEFGQRILPGEPRMILTPDIIAAAKHQ